MGRIYLVRHGETIWNREQRSQGCSNDIPLSELGTYQAKLVAEKLSNKNIDHFYSSSLKRAFETASIISKKHEKKVEICEEFLEINFGDWEGKTFSEIKQNYAELFSIWRDRPHEAIIPGAEPLVALKERCMKKLLELSRKHLEENILIVSHGITTKVMIASILGIDISKIHLIRQDNTAVNIFNFTDNRFEVISLNDVCHLESCTNFHGSFEMK